MAKQAVASVLALALLLGALATFPTGVQSIGVCYGINGDDLPSASDVVQLYEANGIDSVRIYFPDTDMLEALGGSEISVTVGVPNADVASLADPANATAWVRDYVLAFPGVSFRYVAVGNEVAGADTASILPAMRSLNAALSAAGLGHIKVSTAVHTDVTAGFPPSTGTFSQTYMTPIAQYLQRTGAPLLANVYPYFSYINNEMEIAFDYALFTDPGTVVQDGENAYQNLFDALVDTMYSSLESAGARNVSVVVAESGWPSAGSNAANATNAQTYSQNLINHVGRGTPNRPGAIEAYMFATFNEEQQVTLAAEAKTKRHFGLFKPDKSLAYPIKF